MVSKANIQEYLMKTWLSRQKIWQIWEMVFAQLNRLHFCLYVFLNFKSSGDAKTILALLKYLCKKNLHNNCNTDQKGSHKVWLLVEHRRWIREIFVGLGSSHYIGLWLLLCFKAKWLKVMNHISHFLPESFFKSLQQKISAGILTTSV